MLSHLYSPNPSGFLIQPLRFLVIGFLFFAVIIQSVSGETFSNDVPEAYKKKFTTPNTANSIPQKYVHLNVQHFLSGETLITLFKFKVQPTFHINATKVLQNYLIPTSVSVSILGDNTAINNKAKSIIKPPSTPLQSTALTTLWQNASPPQMITFFEEETAVYENTTANPQWHKIILYSSLPKKYLNNANINFLLLQNNFFFQPCTSSICFPPMEIVEVYNVNPNSLAPPPSSITKLANLNSAKNNWNIIQLALAFFAGIVLNLMPCIFPIISLKANAIARRVNTVNNSKKTDPAKKKLPHTSSTGTKRGEIFWNNLGLFLGITVTFLFLATLVASASIGSRQLGWGFQFQHPTYLITMVLLTWGIGMEISNYTRVLEFISLLVSQVARKISPQISTAESQHPISWHCLQGGFNGILVVLLSTPCTAPIFTGVMAYAFSKTLVETYAIFFFLALGFALPQILVTQPFISNYIAKILPKSGIWMDWFKKFLGLFMFITSAWLLTLLPSGSINFFSTPLHIFYSIVIPILFVSIFLLMKKTISSPHSYYRKTILFSVQLCLIMLPFLFASQTVNKKLPPTIATNDHISNNYSWQKSEKESTKKNAMPRLKKFILPLTEHNLTKARNNQSPIFIIVTADWCLSCKWNEKVVLNTIKTKELFEKHRVQILLGDITLPNPFVEGMMHSLGFVGIPLYLIYDTNKNSSPNVLSPLLNFSAVKTAVEASVKK